MYCNLDLVSILEQQHYSCRIMPMSANFLNNQFELNLSWERDEVRFRFRLPIVEKFRYSEKFEPGVEFVYCFWRGFA